MRGCTAGGAFAADIATGSLRNYITLQEVLPHPDLANPRADPSRPLVLLFVRDPVPLVLPPWERLPRDAVRTPARAQRDGCLSLFARQRFHGPHDRRADAAA